MNDENWKQKYLDSLDNLESQEKKWRARETLLKQGLTRVALAAEGLDPQLDTELTLLRETLRSDIDLPRLETVIEDLSHSVKRLDEQRHGQIRADNPQQLLKQWLDSLSFPSPFSSRLKKLRQQIDATHNLTEMETPLRELAQLVNEALQHEDKAGAGARGGFFSRLFGGENAKTADHTSTAAAARPDNDGPRIGDFCIQLLDTLSLPAELSAQVEALKDKLGEGLSDHAVAPTLNAIANIISAMRRQMEIENQELQDFLRQLTENLKDIDQNLAGAKDQHRAAVDSGREFNAVVHAHVKDIETTVDDAPEANQLKQQIQIRLDAIRQHLDQYRHAEESRQQQLEDQLARLNTRVHSMESEGEQLRQRLLEKHQQAVCDPLTGLHNRLAFDERVAQEIARWKRYGQPLVLMMIDIDHFKRVNDSYGHKAGDKALLLITDQLRNHLRESDFLARLGGEEFVVLMPETELASAIVAADKLRSAVEHCQFHYQGKQVPITISAGLAQLQQDDSAERLFQRADEAMYRAKAAGRNRCFTENDH
jgi:diguanylate cyclase